MNGISYWRITGIECETKERVVIVDRIRGAKLAGNIRELILEQQAPGGKTIRLEEIV